MKLILLKLAAGMLMFAGPLPAAPPELKYKLVPQTPPATAVNSVAVSPDGKLIASAAGEGGVRLYDRTGKLLRVIGQIGDRCVVFSPDSRTLTAAGFHMDKLVGLWDVASGRTRTFSGQMEWEADATAISPNGKLLASTATDKQILVWDIASGNLRLRLKDQPFRVSALAFSPDSATLASGSGDKTVRIWDCSSGKLVRSLDGQSEWICAVAFSPDGKWIASGSCDWGFHRGHDWPRPPYRGIEKCEWRLWNAATGKLQRSATSTGRLLSLAFSPSGSSLAAGIGKEVRLYELASQTPGRLLTAHDADVTSLAFTPDGGDIISGSHDQTIHCTRVATGTVQWQAGGSFEQVNCVALSNDASLLVTGSSDWRFARGMLVAGAKRAGPGAVRIWNARSGHLLQRLGDPVEQVMAVAVSPDGRYVASGGGIEGRDGAVHVWDTASGAAVWSTKEHGGEMLALAFSSDGASLAAGVADGTARIYSVKTGQVTQTFKGHPGGVTGVIFSSDGSILYCAPGWGGARAWDVHTGRQTQTLHSADSQMAGFAIDRRTNSISISADGGTLATCASSTNDEFTDSVRFWDTHSGMLRRDFAAEGIHGRPMSLSPDGSVIATGGKSVKLWDARTGKLLRELNGFLKRTQSITFSADGKLIVAGGSYGTTNLWEVASGQHLATLFAFPDLQNGSITDQWLAYTPQGYYDGSSGIEKFLGWRVGEDFQTPQMLGPQLHQPDRVAEAFALPFVKRSVP